jgi:polysaccharide export outer membrane protein
MMRLVMICLVLVALPAAAWSQDQTAYRLGPDDAIQVQVWQRPDLSGTYVVDGEGNITLPLLGAVPVKGMTAAEVGKELGRRYAILDPGISEVVVSVVRYNSHYLTVVGEVANPGRYTFRAMPNLWDALLAAGGTTPQADLGAVQVVRREGAGKEPMSLKVDLSAGVDKTPVDSLPPLEPGDSIIVPSLAREGGVSGDQVRVLGAVRNPGIYPLRGAGTVVEALSASGGAVPGADLGAVRLARRTGGGVLVYELDVKGYLYRGHPSADLGLKPGDTVTVPSRGGGAGNVVHLVLGLAPVLSAVASVILLARR